MSDALNAALANLKSIASKSLQVQDAAEAVLKSVPKMISDAKAGVGGAADVSAAVASLNEIAGGFTDAAAKLAAAVGGVGGGAGPVVTPPAARLRPQPLTLEGGVTRSADALARFGWNTHGNYNDGRYRDGAMIAGQIKAMNFGAFRDTALNPGDQGAGTLKGLIAAGLNMTVYLRMTGGAAAEVARLRELAQVRTGGLVCIAGPNEPNNQNLSADAANAYMAEIVPLIRADALLKNIPIAGFSNWPPTYTPGVDLADLHPYDRKGGSPRAAIQADLDAVREAGYPADCGFVITETGYHTTPTAQPDWEPVDGVTQGRYLLTTLAVALNMGAHAVFIYQLLDAYQDADGTDREKHFGVFSWTNDGPMPAKPAVAMITAFAGLLKDTGAEAKTFTPAPLNVTVQGAPADGRTFVLGKSDGSYLVVTWSEADLWDEVAHKPRAVTPTRQTINFGRTFRTVEVYDPAVSATARQASANAGDVAVEVAGHPLVIKLSD